jgi:hypothetical protein
VVIPFDVQDTAGHPGGSTLLDDILRRVKDSFQSLVKAVTNERLVSVSLSTTPVQVFHGLKGPPLAWEVVGRDAGEVVYEANIVNGQRSRFLYLQATGPVTATVRFT